MSFLDRFRRQKKDAEAERRAQLLRAGRITEGSILDVNSDASGQITHIFFSYCVSGVDYESSQTLDEAQRLRQADYAPGAHVTVRYAPHYPGNSIVV